MNSPVKIELSALLAPSALFLNIVETSSKMVQTAIAASYKVGIKPHLLTSSTNSNIRIAKNAPARTFSRGGKGNGADVLKESWANKKVPRILSLPYWFYWPRPVYDKQITL